MKASDIDNGRRVSVDFGFFVGMAGIMADDAGGEAACPAGPPLGSAPTVGAVDGRPVHVDQVRRSDIVRSMSVVTFRWSVKA